MSNTCTLLLSVEYSSIAFTSTTNGAVHRVATLPGKTLKNLEFDNLGKNNLKKPGI